MLVVVWMTFLVGLLAARFDAWITRAHDGAEDKAESRRVVPTSLLVVAGVAVTETLRVVRWGFILWAILREQFEGSDIVLALLTLLALWPLDAFTSYGVTGLPMIRGDLAREARVQAERVAIRLAAMQEGGGHDHATTGGGLPLESDKGPGA